MVGPTAVRFGEGRRPETATHVQVAAFDGPLALLLSLIEARQLDVLTVPLGGLADAYLEALANLEADRLGNVSSFVAVASQLILIKSRAMLPRRDGADGRGDRRRRAGSRGGAAGAAAAVPGLPRRRAAPGVGRARPLRPVPARAGRGAGGRPGRCAARPTPRRSTRSGSSARSTTSPDRSAA